MTKLIPTLQRVPQQRIATLGNNLRACIVGVTPGASLTEPWRVLLFDAQGRTAVWPLTGVSSNGDDACCALLPTVPGSVLPGFLVVASKNQSTSSKVVVQEFRLPGDPFSAAPTPSQAPPPYGDGQSRQTELVVMPSGELVACTHQQALPAVDVIVRSLAGVWGPSQRVSISSAVGNSTQFSACVAPWDGTLFMADIFDGAMGGDAATFTLAGGRLALKSSFPQVINRNIVNGVYVMGVLASNGEITALVATTDQINRRVNLGYTNVQFPTEGPEAGTRQAHPVVAGIAAGAVVVQVAVSADWVLSILNPCIPVTQAGSVTLCYATGYPTQNLLQCAGQSVPLGSSIYAYSTAAKAFVVIQADKTVALVQLDIVPPTPIPPPVKPSVSFVTTGVRLAVFVQPPSTPVKWSSDVQGDLGSGPVLEGELRAVEQTITASITLPDGSTAKATYKVTPGH
jgi:hypothetical protein